MSNSQSHCQLLEARTVDVRSSDRLRDRWEVFETLLPAFRRSAFCISSGAYAGDSICYWAKKRLHPDAQLHGFDSFEGLPEDWGPHNKGHFDIGGRIPEVSDPRVRFFKGWFDEVLPNYVVPEHDILVVVKGHSS